MTTYQALVARTSLSAIMGGVSIVVCSLRRPFSLPRASFDWMVNAAFVLSRLGLYLLVFFILRITPRGDVPNFYWPQAHSALAHLAPYRDFYSSYAPLHPYLDAIVVTLWHSPLAIVLLAISAELFLLPLWLSVGRIFLTEHEVRMGALLYLTSALSVQFVTINGQNNVIIAVLVVLALLLVYRNRVFASGAAVGLGAAAIKFLALLYIPAFFTVVPRRWRWLAGASLVLAIGYGAIGMFAHRMILQPLTFESALRSGNDFPFLFEGITGITLPSAVWDTLVLAICASIFLLIFVKSRAADMALRLRILTFGIPALTVTLILFSKKSWPPYLMLCLFPICLLIRRKLHVAAFALFGIVTVFSPSYWDSVLEEVKANDFHQGLLSHDPRCLAFLPVEILQLFFYAWILRSSLEQIYRAPVQTDVARPRQLSVTGV